MINNFQYRLRKAMSDKNMTASELSRVSGVGKSDISNYINGVYVAKQDKCYLLAKALDVDPGWLMTGDDPASPSFDIPEIPFTVSSSEARIISTGVDKLNKQDREKALAVFRAMFGIEED